MFGEEVVNVLTSSSRRAQRSTLPQRQVKFEAFNETYDITLEPSTGLLSPNFVIIIRDGSDMHSSSVDELSNCFYRGQEAAFDLCRGMVKNSISYNFSIFFYGETKPGNLHFLEGDHYPIDKGVS